MVQGKWLRDQVDSMSAFARKFNALYSQGYVSDVSAPRVLRKEMRMKSHRRWL